MYSASIVEVATDLNFRLLHAIAPPPSRKTYPIVDFRSTLSLAKSLSKYLMTLTSSGSPLYSIPYVIVESMYQRIQIMVVQWFVLGFELNWLTFPTAKASSG